MKFFAKRLEQTTERRVYELIVAQARQPWFYADLQVPDSVEGRYEMIMLHCFMVFERLSGTGSAADAFSQLVFDELFKDMDRSLRELGVGDLAVGKKVRKMAEMFYGRSEAYRAALANEAVDHGAELKGALERNVYDGTAPANGLDQLARYVVQLRDCLVDHEIDPILAGELKFPEPGSSNYAHAG
ncbi:MAG: ubiquinol-cytochrome C chaperone [Rhizobiales bacterium]|nr:ubiquinol-cytochrome C chaperone [Hyphomicrobiales bacterium]